EEPVTLRRTGIELAVLGIAFLGYGLISKKLPAGSGIWVILMGAAWIAFGAWCVKPLRMSVKMLLGGLAACLLLLTLTAERAAGSKKEMARLVKAAPADAVWISYGVYRQGIPWYTGRRCVVLDGTGELAYGRGHLQAEDQERWLPENRGGLPALAARLKGESGRTVVVAAQPEDWDRLPDPTRDAFTVIARNEGTVLAEFR
ncbi:MAG TPA: hypothetical protein VFF77_06045, partial [Holophagaceae bacterium]|nr:hypothetical protein [Holophagaceae bacterium]